MKEVTILLADQPLGLEAHLAAPLRFKGYRVLSAPDGRSLLRILEQCPTGVVLAPERLPDMEAVDLCRHIARCSSDTRVIILSSDPQTEAARQSFMVGVYDYLPWPATEVNALLSLVDRAAHEFALLRRNRRLLEQLESEGSEEEPSPPVSHEERRQHLELDVLRVLSNDLSALKEVRQIMGTVNEHVSRLFDYALLAVLVEERDHTDLFVFTRGGAATPFVEAGLENLLTLHGMFRGRAWSRERVRIHRPEDPPRPAAGGAFSDAGKELRSHITFPLVAGGETIGSISMASPRSGAFGASELQIFSLLVYQVASAIRNAQLFRTTQEMAITDPLTGLYNRRHFEEILDHACFSVQRYGHPLSLAMVDLDHFKRINDTMGHPAGDAVLRQIATLLQRSLRRVDVVARYGGEEFILMLPQTPLEQAAVLAERLRLAVQGQTLVVSQYRLNLTVSIGVAAMGEGVGEKKSLIQRADEALLVAKRQGRNQVCLYLPHTGVVEARRLGGRERRSSPRREIRLPLRYVTVPKEEVQAFFGRSHNLSAQGIAFEGEKAVAPGSFALLDLTLPPGNQGRTVPALAQIVWNKEQGGKRPTLMGGRLIPLSPEVQQQVAELLEDRDKKEET